VITFLFSCTLLSVPNNVLSGMQHTFLYFLDLGIIGSPYKILLATEDEDFLCFFRIYEMYLSIFLHSVQFLQIFIKLFANSFYPVTMFLFSLTKFQLLLSEDIQQEMQSALAGYQFVIPEDHLQSCCFG